jgi:hypothetical protein
MGELRHMEQGVAEGSLDQRIAHAKKNNPLQASVRQHQYGYTALVTDANTGKPSWFGGAVWQTPELAMGHAKAFVKGFPYLEQRFAQRFVDKNFDGIVDQGVAEGIDDLARILELSGLNLSADEQFDIIEDMVESLALQHRVDTEIIWEDLESVDDQELLDEAAAWRTSKGKSKTGGLNAKGVASYRRENPGSKLQMAVTTKPSKLKPGSKAAKRRKSFCARMGGMKGPMKKPNGKPTRKALALRKWNC